MRFWQHIMITFSFLFPFAYGNEAFYGVMAFAIFGSVFPDLDAIELRGRDSRLARVLHAIKMALYYPISAVFSVLFFKDLIKHRGFAHTLLAGIIFSAILYGILKIAGLNIWIALFFFIGYVMHILEDCFTSSGTEPFIPFKTRISGRMDTSSPLLAAISFCFLAPILLLLGSEISMESAKGLEILMLAVFALTLKTN